MISTMETTKDQNQRQIKNGEDRVSLGYGRDIYRGYRAGAKIILAQKLKEGSIRDDKSETINNLSKIDQKRRGIQNKNRAYIFKCQH